MLTPQENRIMDLWDRGASKGEVARQTGLRFEVVSRTVDYYHCAHEQREFEEMAANGSAALLTAIKSIARPAA